jgi:hypothetical protein
MSLLLVRVLRVAGARVTDESGGMTMTIQAISQARQRTQAAYHAYRLALREDMRADAPRGSYTRREWTLGTYHRLAAIEARLRDAYRLAHGVEAAL